MATVPSKGKTVLISGINGYIASAIGLELLKKGYNLRGTSRSASSAVGLLQGTYKEYMDAGRIDIVTIEDMTIPGAFDEAVKGVHIIIHTASPINFSFTSWDHFVPIAVAGAVGILTSAYKHAGPQLESFVITSSIAAIIDPSKSPYTFSEADWNTYSYDKAKELGDQAPAGLLYQASKTAAERSIWQFRDEYKPAFAITSVNPGVVIGPPVQPPAHADALNETLKPLWIVFSGQSPTGTIPRAIGSASYIDIRDTAAMHVWAAEHPAEANGQRYLLANGKGTPQAAADILRKAYPGRKEILVGEPGSDYVEGWGWPEGGQSFDSEKSKKALRREFIKYDQSVLNTAKVFESVPMTQAFASVKFVGGMTTSTTHVSIHEYEKIILVCEPRAENLTYLKSGQMSFTRANFGDVMWRSPPPPTATSLYTPSSDAASTPSSTTTSLFSSSLIAPHVLNALPEGYTIRPLQRSDYGAGVLDVLRVLTSVGDVSEERWAERYEWMKGVNALGEREGGGGEGGVGTYFVLVVVAEGRIVGTGAVVVERKFIHNLGLVGHIEDIAVMKDQQGKKLGLRIIEALDYLAERVGCYKTILDCSEANEGFYIKCGYKRAGLEMSHYYDGGGKSSKSRA